MPAPRRADDMPATTPAGRHRGLMFAAVCLGVFMVLFDLTLTNLAVPHIMRGFRTEIAQAEWVMNAFELTLAMTLIVLGRLGDLRGRRTVFIAGLFVFLAASIACALAPSPDWLIGFRVVEGLAAAMMVPQTLSIISASFPAERRGAAVFARFPDIDPDTLIAFLGALIDLLKGRTDA